MNDPENRVPFFKDQDPALVTMCITLHVNYATRKKLRGTQGKAKRAWRST